MAAEDHREVTARPKPGKRTEAEAVLRGVDSVVFPKAGGEQELWYYSHVQPNKWWPLQDTGAAITTEEMYQRIKAEDHTLRYAKNGVFGKMDHVAYAEVCGLVSRLLRKQLTYKEFRQAFWGLVEGPPAPEAGVRPQQI